MSESYALADRCSEAVKSADQKVFERLNDRLQNSKYKVIVLARHGKASEENKFSSEEREMDPFKIQLDIERPLAKKGEEAAKKLAHVFQQLKFRDLGMWGSQAHRVVRTALPSMVALGHRVKTFEFQEELYYADVTAEMKKRLVSQFGENLPHAFFWGHGKSTLELFKHLTGATDGFLPTSSVLIVTIKADSWSQVFNEKGTDIESFGWSPNQTLRVEGAKIQSLND